MAPSPKVGAGTGLLEKNLEKSLDLISLNPLTLRIRFLKT